MNSEINKSLVKNEGLFNTTSEKSCKMRISVSVVMFVFALFEIARVVFMIAKIGISNEFAYEDDWKGMLAKLLTKSYPVTKLKVDGDTITDVQEYGIVDYIFAIAQAVIFAVIGALVITGVLNITVSVPSIIFFVLFVVLKTVMFFLREKLVEFELYKGKIVSDNNNNNTIGMLMRIMILALYIILPLSMVLVSIRSKSALSIK